MHPDYSNALEKRREWLDFVNTGGLSVNEPRIISLYQRILASADTFVMNAKFCEMVDVARRTVPDDLRFEETWTPTANGWMFIAAPFLLPRLRMHANNTDPQRYETRIAAIGWTRLTEEQLRTQPDTGRPLKPGAVQFCTFLDWSQHRTDIGFSAWSYFTLNPGDALQGRMDRLESVAEDDGMKGGSYVEDKTGHDLHELRWLYTALHLMSQRLATTVKKDATRGTRRRFERDRTPIAPEYRIVTLRRMEEARAKEGGEHQVDWKWSWAVSGHWRNHWFPVEQEHKQIWIDSYVKGDLEKPLKPTKTLYRIVK